MDLSIHRIGDDVPAGSLQVLVRHWLDLYHQAGGQVPSLRALDPLCFGAALSDVWIVDAVEDGRFRMRLSGETLADWYGASLRGRYYEDIFNPQSLPGVTVMTRAVMERPLAVYQRMTAEIADRSEPAGFCRVGLPLTGANGRICHMLGATQFDTPVINGRGSIATRPEIERLYAIAAPADLIVAETAA